MTLTRTTNIKLGVLFALTASLCNTIMSVFIKILGSGQSTETILFSFFFIGFLLLLPWAFTDKALFKINNKGKLLLRSMTSVLTMSCVFYSLKYMPVANVLLLNNTFPLFLPLLSWLLLKIKTPMKMWTGIIVGFIGVTLILHPVAKSFNWHALIALGAGLLAALSMLQIRLLIQDGTDKGIVFYFMAFGTVATAIFVPFSFKMPNAYQMGLLFFIGLFGVSFQFFLTLTLKYITASIVAPVYFSCILFAAIFDWFIWAIKLTTIEIIGISMVIAGVILTILLTPKAKLPGSTAKFPARKC